MERSQLGQPRGSYVNRRPRTPFPPRRCGAVRRLERPAGASTRRPRSTPPTGRSCWRSACGRAGRARRSRSSPAAFVLWTLLEYLVHRFILHGRFPDGHGVLPPLPAQVLRPPALGAPRAALGRQPRERDAQGHAGRSRSRSPRLGFLAPLPTRRPCSWRACCSATCWRSGCITRCTSAVPATATSATSGGTTSTTTARGASEAGSG